MNEHVVEIVKVIGYIIILIVAILLVVHILKMGDVSEDTRIFVSAICLVFCAVMAKWISKVGRNLETTRRISVKKKDDEDDE